MSRIFVNNLEAEWDTIKAGIKQEMISRAYLGANELRNQAVDKVLKGRRSGRTYRVPMTKKHYRASAPGEPPAVRTGLFRMSWHPEVTVEGQQGDLFIVKSEITNSLRVGEHLLGEILEHGTTRMAPRPHHEKIQKAALPAIKRIYDRPYGGGG